MRFFVLLIGAALSVAAAPPAPSTFTTAVVPLLKTRCATCHLTGKEAGMLQLTPNAAYANLVNVKSAVSPKLVRVVPGKPHASYLVMKLEGKHIVNGGQGARMPFGAPPLTAEQIGVIRNWIADGAKK